MTFEEQLTRAFETLTERLRGEIDQQVQRTAAELLALAPPDRGPVTIGTGWDEWAVATARQEGREHGLADGREEARREIADTSAAAPADTSLARLGDAMRAIDGTRSLTEVLDTLLAVASWDASGVNVWLLRGGRLHRWPGTGTDQDQPPDVQSLDTAGPIAEAARHNATAHSDALLAVPIALAGQVVAVFSANRDPRIEAGQPRVENLELLVRYAAKTLEALTAFKTARALTQRSAPAAVAPQPVQDNADSEEDTSARRFARLLVSEIKLYHEPAVAEGRRDRDLATRLGGEIARARVMYEQRVPVHVRQRADYFHDELVRTLANGDASLLEVRS